MSDIAVAGLLNLGNTCYFNTALQVRFTISSAFFEFFSSFKDFAHMPHGSYHRHISINMTAGTCKLPDVSRLPGLPGCPFRSLADIPGESRGFPDICT
jgi:hypothetical protein